MSYDIYNRTKLTEEEEADIAALEKNFNIIPESTEYDYVASRRVVMSKEWTKKLLLISFYMNVISTVLVLSCVVILLTKPTPKYFGSTPSGQVIPLKLMNKS